MVNNNCIFTYVLILKVDKAVSKIPKPYTNI